MRTTLWLLVLLTACSGGDAKDACVEDCVTASDSDPTTPGDPVDAVDPEPEPFDTGTPQERCNGIDDDGDGLIDEDPIDGTVFYADSDGDGFGDFLTEIVACEEGDGWVVDPTDCDDTDASVNALAPDVANGRDDDCDGRIDEIDVAFVAANQCTATPDRAAATTIEVEEVRAFLTELGLTMIRLDADPGGSVRATTDLSAFSLIFYTKCGWAWTASNTGDVDVIHRAIAGEAALFVFGDDMAYQMASVPAAEPLVMLAPSNDNGTSASQATMVFDTTSTHPAYTGPYGTPVDYSYAWDMDRSSITLTGAVELAQHGSFASPVFVVWEHPTSHRRQATLLASVYNANHGSPGSAARINGEIVFKNIVTWLLRIQLP